MRTITEIIIHCTATPAGRHVSVAEIDLWHRREASAPSATTISSTLTAQSTPDAPERDRRALPRPQLPQHRHSLRRRPHSRQHPSTRRHPHRSPENRPPKAPERSPPRLSQGPHTFPPRFCRQSLPLLRRHRRIRLHLKTASHLPSRPPLKKQTVPEDRSSGTVNIIKM